jgi:hypothetical protein
MLLLRGIYFAYRRHPLEARRFDSQVQAILDHALRVTKRNMLSRYRRTLSNTSSELPVHDGNEAEHR